MKKLITLFTLVSLTLIACGQASNTFKYVINANGGVTVPVNTFKIGAVMVTRTGTQLNYLDVGSSVQGLLNAKVAVADTASMLTPYINHNDTVAMLVPYINHNDTVALMEHYAKNTAVALKLPKTDTTAMLVPYVRDWEFNNDIDVEDIALLKHIPIHIKTASHTLELIDDGALIAVGASGATNITVPPYSSVPFESGTQIKIECMNTDLVTIVPGSGVTVVSKNNVLVLDTTGSATLTNITTNTWKLNATITNNTNVVVEPPVGSDLLTGLLGYWKLDDASTTINDEVGVSDLTATGTSQSSTKILGYSQQIGSGDIMRYGSAPTPLLPTSDKLSIDCWIRMTSLPSTETHSMACVFFSKNEDPWSAVSLFIASWDDKAYFTIYNQAGTASTVNSASSLSANTWYHITGVCRGNGQTLQLYINGSDVSTTAGTPSMTGFLTGVDDLFLGTDGNPGDNFIVGYMDEVGIWNVALTPAQVTSRYNSGTGITYPFL